MNVPSQRRSICDGKISSMPNSPRRFHLCLSPAAIAAEPGLLQLVKDAGVTDIWTTGFLYGYWYFDPPAIQRALQAIAGSGLQGHVANVPLGHPGDSLGARDEDVPLSPPAHWRMGVDPDGSQHSGTSLHPPAVEENASALQVLQSRGVGEVFLDDDFRLAVAPGRVGGCFCAEHRQRFLDQHGYSLGQWEELRVDIHERRLTRLLRQWVDFTCDELSAAFRQQQAAAPQVRLGIMVMYLGAEKAGIRLPDYSAAPFRVGELMFDDASFGRVKGKTDELFSVLFHRRFTAPEQAYSETTAFPAGRLSAANLAAKLNISLIADVRNTMFMSGLTPFPSQHWSTLAGAIRRQSGLHPLVSGQVLKGPLKHFWGVSSRYTGDDDPYSLFLALGIPFEVVEEAPQDGWTFLSRADIQELPDLLRAGAGAEYVIRPGSAPASARCREVEESLPALFEFKHRVVEPHLRDVPYVVEDMPIVCAWYPAVRRALLWNLSEEPRQITLRLNDQARSIRLGPLEAQVCELA